MLKKKAGEITFEEIETENLKDRVNEFLSTWVEFEDENPYFTYRGLERYLLDEKENTRLGYNSSAKLGKLLTEMLNEGIIYQNFGWTSQCFSDEERDVVSSDYVFGITDKFVPITKS